jgi:hypothetical protein
MSRALIILNTAEARNKAADWVRRAPFGSRVEFKGARRSLPQNDRLWAHLTDVAEQATHAGRKFTADKWKVIFMSALGQELQFVPSLDGQSFIPLGHSSSDLSKEEMTALIDFIESWGAQNGVTFHDEPVPAHSPRQVA